ncbi:MAG TPA: hypothetical protein VFV69_00805 [Steroidobacteraceae bacterium]|jgi:hypothetical protein|nr:hypothetical protein [Steroidobacteraceae bacterium]
MRTLRVAFLWLLLCGALPPPGAAAAADQSDDLELAGELTECAFPADAVATMLPLASLTTSHEDRYERRRVEEIPADRLLGLPLLLQLPRVG